jgi:hypothetical protein
MKDKLRIVGLAFCILPACLHARAGQDLKPVCQSAELIPAGTYGNMSGSS